MSNTKLPAQVREGYPELHEFDGAEYVKASDYDSRLHASDVYFDSWKNTEAQFNQQKLAMDAACGEIALLKEELENYQLSASHQVVKGIVEAAVGDTVNILLGAVKASEACGGPVWVITATQDGVMRKRVISPFEWSEDSQSMYEWAEGMEISQAKIFPDAVEVSQ